MQMRRTLLIVSVALVWVAACAQAATWTAGALSSYGSMKYANSLVSEARELPGASAALSVSYGLRLQGSADLEWLPPRVYGAVWGVGATVKEREFSANASLIAVALGAETSFSHWTVYAGLCGGRASFDLPAAGLVDLAGWGAGVEIGAGLVFVVSPHLGVAFRLGGQWLPVPEMSDARGQEYRGRGMPFVDYTGLVASIGISWSP